MSSPELNDRYTNRLLPMVDQAPSSTRRRKPPVTCNSAILSTFLNSRNLNSVQYTPYSEAESLNTDQSAIESDKDKSSADCASCSSTDSDMAEKRGASDFIFGKIIGEGSFSTVYLAKDIHTKREFAIKACIKRFIVRENKVAQTYRERDILSYLTAHKEPTAPFFVKLYFSFHDRERLYFVLSHAKNGDLFYHINKVGSFDHACSQFYAAEILYAFEHIHSLGIVHRDLKPENILLDHRMHIRISDFGSAKVLTNRNKIDAAEDGARRRSFVGTAQYIAPELLSDSGECSPASDIWAFGAIVYQMVAGLPPFRSSSEYIIFQKIKKLDYEFPDGFNSTARDLVQRLLILDPKLRLGARGDHRYYSIRKHPFLSGVDFESLYKQTPPVIHPYLPEEELQSDYQVPDHLEPGLGNSQISRLLGFGFSQCLPPSLLSPEPGPGHKSLLGLESLSRGDIAKRLTEQKLQDPKWHALCSGDLILKRGLVQKRAGLFSRRQMLLLTLGPHLYYVDPKSMAAKGEIPWSPELRVEPKNFKDFYIHTPNRTYHIQDPDGYAQEWCKAIEEVRAYTLDKNKSSIVQIMETAV